MTTKKTSAQIKRALNLKCAAKGIPVSGIFELTPRCNLHCPMCYIRLTPEEMTARGREYTAEEWLKLAEAAKEDGMLFLLLTGGEPMIRKDFVEIYEGLAKMGLAISLNTNGTVLRDEIKDVLLRYPPAQVNITVYGVSAEDYEVFCGSRDAFEQMQSSVRWLKEHNILLHLNATMTPENLHRWEDFERFAEAEELELRMATYCFPPVRKLPCQDFERLSPETAGELTVKDFLYRNGIDAVREKAEKMDLAPNGCFLEEGEAMQCLAGRAQFWINWNGDMVPCGMMDRPAARPFEAGFTQAWEFLKVEAGKIRLCPECTDCPDKMSCTNCAAVTYTETGRFDGRPDYVCKMSRAYRNALETYAGRAEKTGDESL